MANEELVQRRYLATGTLKGDPFGIFEEFNIGATTVGELRTSGLTFNSPSTVAFPFKHYKPLKSPLSAKPDRVFALRRENELIPVAVGEDKETTKMTGDKPKLKAAEQALFAAASLGVRIAVTTNGNEWFYVDVEASTNKGEIVYFEEHRDFNPAVLENLVKGDAAVAKDPKPLAETVWQIIWHATKEEPKQCLLTFVEIFILKFLSDNLPKNNLPERLSFYFLLEPPDEFQKKNGTTAINYYVSQIRPHIKKLFPDNTIADDEELPKLFGLKTVVSKTSVINGFAFLRSSDQTLDNFNRTFLQILETFKRFGSLTAIDPEFKLRLYETFLKNTPRQQKLGQFFTPRNVVRQMIRMAQLNKLPDDAVVLDPAAGVGGFVLEPLLIADALKDDIKIEGGKAVRRVRTVGVDVDASTHILAKANTLIHLAELLRDPTTTLEALNRVMADTFVLMNSNEMLGALENPPRDSIDVILTNPPYVTEGSRVYRDEIAAVQGQKNGVSLKSYYEGCGLGLESLFIRYISGALKPGGRAFVIVPLGMLNRTEPKPKQKLLDECNIIGSIGLPRNTFFNTSQPTCIIILERRRTKADPRPDVFCGYVRTIGETLDMYRVPTPHDNDLEAVTDLFLKRQVKKPQPIKHPLVKIVSATNFSAADRWDVARFWTEEELVALGERESGVDRTEFIDEAMKEIAEVSKELEAAKEELKALTSGPSKEVNLSDTTLFNVRSGTRITTAQVRSNPGDVPVYSCFKEPSGMKGKISEEFLKKLQKQMETPKKPKKSKKNTKKSDEDQKKKERRLVIESKPIATVMANGAKAVGRVFVRDEKCVITDDVIAVEVLRDDIDVEYVANQLRSGIASGNFLYEAKLFTGRVRQLSITLPVKSDGSFDLDQQKTIALAVKRFDNIRARLHNIGKWSESVRIA